MIAKDTLEPERRDEKAQKVVEVRGIRRQRVAPECVGVRREPDFSRVEQKPRRAERGAIAFD
jgi:hypothetical protein